MGSERGYQTVLPLLSQRLFSLASLKSRFIWRSTDYRLSILLMDTPPFIETFPALSALGGLVHGFILRNPEIDVKTDRETALARLEEHHVASLKAMGIAREHLATAEQVHGDVVAACDPDAPFDFHFPEADGLMTRTVGQYLGIYVADCGAAFIVDPERRACSVVHSGKNGTAAGIVPNAIQRMVDRYGSDPNDLIVQLAPCIRPPAYEIDFAAQILEDCEKAGVPAEQIHDCGTCTSTDLDRYYSYRIEKGETGRLFAVMGWESEA